MDSTNSRSCSRICKRLYYSKERRQFPHRKPLRLLKALLNKMGQSTAHGLKRRLRSFKSMVSLFYGYTGGIIRTRDAKQEHYEFFIDKKAVLLLN